jgi:hypothetical protein
LDKKKMKSLIPQAVRANIMTCTVLRQYTSSAESRTAHADRCTYNSAHRQKECL